MTNVFSSDFFRFFTISILNLLIDLLFITIMVELFRLPERFADKLPLFPTVSEGEFIARGIAYGLTFCIAFALQSKYTFKQKSIKVKQIKKYFVVTGGLTVWQLFAFPLFLHLLKVLFQSTDQAPIQLFYASVVLAGATSLIISFLLNKYWTFKADN